jgi:hypothetical protein
LPVKINWPTSKLMTAVSSATGNTNAAMTPALAARTRRLVGVTANVERIIPVAYSAVMARTPSAARTTAPTKTMPTREQAVGSNVWRCPAVIFDHRCTWETQRIAPRPTEITVAITTVRQVEGRVRSLVHSASAILRFLGARTGTAVGVM